MKVFRCDHCQHLVFFENVRCVNCDRVLAFLPDFLGVGSLEPAGGERWRSPLPLPEGREYRLCENYDRENVCNWAIPAEDLNPLCQSCRLTRVIPDLSQPGSKDAWYRLEVAKRRLVYSLLRFGLPLESKAENPGQGLAFEFLADDAKGAQPVLTGHSNGVITINIAEARDPEREERRVQLHEPYRTVLGHFRHEIGHYYWGRLIENGDRIDAFRNLFGDEREDYGNALQRHYEAGAPENWQEKFVSAYASAHPWEDWAEIWAHYLHMTDVLETASTCGLSLQPKRPDEPSLEPEALSKKQGHFDRLIADWFSVTYALNNLNRSMGLPDGYPFILSPPVIDKLRFVHETIQGM
jgi:hypothetical protein